MQRLVAILILALAVAHAAAITAGLQRAPGGPARVVARFEAGTLKPRAVRPTTAPAPAATAR